MNIPLLFLIIANLSLSLTHCMEDQEEYHIERLTHTTSIDLLTIDKKQENTEEVCHEGYLVCLAPVYRKAFKFKPHESIKKPFYNVCIPSSSKDIDAISVNGELAIECWSTKYSGGQSPRFTFNGAQNKDIPDSTLAIQNDALFIANYPDAIRMYNIKEQKVGVFAKYNKTIKHLLLCQKLDPNLLFSADESGSIKWWDLRTGMMAQTVQAHNGAANHLISINGKLYSCGEDASIKSWDLRTNKCVDCIKEVDGGTPYVQLAGMDGDKENFFVIQNCSENFILKKISNLSSEAFTCENIEINRDVNQIKAHNNFLYCALDGTLQTRDFKTGCWLAEFYGHNGYAITDFDINPQDQTILTCGKDGTIIKWKED